MSQASPDEHSDIETAAASKLTPNQRAANLSKLGKGYSYLFAAMLTMLIGVQCLDASFKMDGTGRFHISVSTRETSPYIFYTYTALIASILGLPTDAIALFVGQLLDKGKQ